MKSTSLIFAFIDVWFCKKNFGDGEGVFFPSKALCKYSSILSFRSLIVWILTLRNIIHLKLICVLIEVEIRYSPPSPWVSNFFNTISWKDHHVLLGLQFYLPPKSGIFPSGLFGIPSGACTLHWCNYLSLLDATLPSWFYFNIFILLYCKLNSLCFWHLSWLFFAFPVNISNTLLIPTQNHGKMLVVFVLNI